MREKELRIALVCFGGISLAVYMHGITKEVLKLVRASSAFHAIDRSKRQSSSFFDARDSSDLEFDTEAVYFELLRDIGATLELRVIVDVVAGASAGGINSVMLSRALAHDLPMEPLRALWLDNADVTELLAPEARAGRLSKWFLRPLFWVAEVSGLKLISDIEVRTKLSLFMRSRWFEPPFDGTRMAELMYDAVLAMGEPKTPTASLLPTNQKLDLFVTVTDFYGCNQIVQIHDPPVIHEREHRLVLHFSYRRHPGGFVETDFDSASAPALAFAARATSSLPGIFPPAQIAEMDRLVNRRSARWPRRAEFIAKNFSGYADMNVDVASVPFVDGSVLNSRPFSAAVTAIPGRAAYREIDRRVLYIDPNPTSAGMQMHRGVPGFFQALKGALSDIPLAEPVTDELTWVASFNARVRLLSGIVEGARPQISRLIATLISPSIDQSFDSRQIHRWRDEANNKAAREAGFAYEAYVRLKLTSVRSFIAQLLVGIRGARSVSPFARAINEVVDAWAVRTGVMYNSLDGSARLAEDEIGAASIPKWVDFLLSFDIDYRKRRLRFLIEGQNRLYEMLGSKGFEDVAAADIDGLKRQFYERIETLDRCEKSALGDATVRDLAEDIFRVAPSPGEVRNIKAYAQSFAMRHEKQLGQLIEKLAAAINLKATTEDIDTLMERTSSWPRAARYEVLVNYLGFPFWDVLTLPLMQWREAGEFNEIRIDRISAQDAAAVSKLGGFRLKGDAFNQFAAFLSRAYRENDYLLGRMHAVDRLIDLVCDAAGGDSPDTSRVVKIKIRAFRRVLDAEERHLRTCAAMIAELRIALDAAEAAGSFNAAR